MQPALNRFGPSSRILRCHHFCIIWHLLIAWSHRNDFSSLSPCTASWIHHLLPLTTTTARGQRRPRRHSPTTATPAAPIGQPGKGREEKRASPQRPACPPGQEIRRRSRCRDSGSPQRNHASGCAPWHRVAPGPTDYDLFDGIRSSNEGDTDGLLMVTIDNLI